MLRDGSNVADSGEHLLVAENFRTSVAKRDGPFALTIAERGATTNVANSMSIWDW